MVETIRKSAPFADVEDRYQTMHVGDLSIRRLGQELALSRRLRATLLDFCAEQGERAVTARSSRWAESPDVNRKIEEPTWPLPSPSQFVPITAARVSPRRSRVC